MKYNRENLELILSFLEDYDPQTHACDIKHTAEVTLKQINSEDETLKKTYDIIKTLLGKTYKQKEGLYTISWFKLIDVSDEFVINTKLIRVYSNSIDISSGWITCTHLYNEIVAGNIIEVPLSSFNTILGLFETIKNM